MKNSTEYIKACLITESTGSPEGDAKYLAEVNARSNTVEGQRMIHAALGVGSEAGELIDAVKRFVRYGKPVDRVNVIEEFGDVCWYLALIADQYGFTFEEAFATNIAKLKVRYADKFKENSALNRNLDAERAALETT